MQIVYHITNSKGIFLLSTEPPIVSKTLTETGWVRCNRNMSQAKFKYGIGVLRKAEVIAILKTVPICGIVFSLYKSPFPDGLVWINNNMKAKYSFIPPPQLVNNKAALGYIGPIDQEESRFYINTIQSNKRRPIVYMINPNILKSSNIIVNVPDEFKSLV